MLSSLGIIPAAGQATRFGGVYKELLPVTGQTLLQRAVSILGTCEKSVIITTVEKIAAHAANVGNDVMYLLASPANGLWGAMRLGMTLEADKYYFVMPDTYIPITAFSALDFVDFALGTFITDTPGNFGVLREGIVYDKNDEMPTPATAWGVLAWSKAVRDMWMHSKLDTYTQAINAAIGRFGYKTFALDYYRDIGNFKAYARLLREIDDQRLQG